MAIETKNRTTTLEEDASIYEKRKESSERQKWKNMNRTERITIFKEYYLKILIGALAVSCVVIYLIYETVSSYRQTQLFTVIINDSIETQKKEEFSKEVSHMLKINTKKQEVVFDTDYILSGNGGSSSATSAQQRIVAYIYAKDLDIIIADEQSYNTYVMNGSFYDLTKVLSKEELEKYSPYFYIPPTATNPDNHPYGINLEKSLVYQSLGVSQPSPIFGIISNTTKLDNALKLLAYLFPDESKTIE